MRAVLFLSILFAPSPVFAGGYVVLESVGDEPGYRAAAEKLAAHHGAEILTMDPAAPEKALAALTRLAPENVALVMLPGQVEYGFQRRFLEMATRLDEDPFVDFSFGYITGATGEDALALVEAGLRVAKRPLDVKLGSLGGGSKACGEPRSVYRFRETTLPVLKASVRGDAKGHDREFVARFLKKLAGCSAIKFVGHGYPDRVVGGIDWRDLAGLRLDGAVVLNVACWTGVTGTWYERQRGGGLLKKELPPEQSFALALLGTGLSGYTAYLCPRPAGPELDRDLVALVVEGLSLGEARRRDYDKTVLGFLGYGEERLALPAPEQIGAGAAGIDAVRDMMLEGATGGVVFGDPALRPFAPRPGEDPVRITRKVGKNAIAVKAACPRHSLWLQCAEPTGRIRGESAMKVYTRFPLEDFPVEDVVVDHVRVGGKELASRVVWAVEEDRGTTFLHAKVVYPYLTGGTVTGDLDLAFTVRRASSPDRAKLRGGTTEKPIRRGSRGPRRDLGQTEVDDALLAAAAPYRVPQEALTAALVATAALLGKGEVGREEATAALAKFGSRGFRAVCALLEVGHQHIYTPLLLKATWRSGDEKLLIALAGKDLPGHAGWSVLEGLGHTGATAARKYLLDRIGRESDPGLFTWTARGLAVMKEGGAVEPVGEQLLRFGPRWSGLERYLVAVLGAIGDEEAKRYLERYAEDPRAKHAKSARRHLGN